MSLVHVSAFLYQSRAVGFQVINPLTLNIGAVVQAGGEARELSLTTQTHQHHMLVCWRTNIYLQVAVRGNAAKLRKGSVFAAQPHTLHKLHSLPQALSPKYT